MVWFGRSGCCLSPGLVFLAGIASLDVSKYSILHDLYPSEHHVTCFSLLGSRVIRCLDVSLEPYRGFCLYDFPSLHHSRLDIASPADTLSKIVTSMRIGRLWSLPEE